MDDGGYSTLLSLILTGLRQLFQKPGQEAQALEGEATSGADSPPEPVPSPSTLEPVAATGILRLSAISIVLFFLGEIISVTVADMLSCNGPTCQPLRILNDTNAMLSIQVPWVCLIPVLIAWSIVLARVLSRRWRSHHRRLLACALGGFVLSFIAGAVLGPISLTTVSFY